MTPKFHAIAAVLIATAICSTSSIAQTGVDQMKPSAAPVMTAGAAKDMADGEVRKIDKAGMKVTLKHGAIKNLDMPGMTMVFQVKDASLLDKLAVGTKVKFSAENVNGAIVVTAVEAVI